MPERNLDFDRIIERRHTDSLKYDFAKRRGLPEDVLPLWVADMDFQTSSYIIDALKERSEHGIFGYTETQTPYFEIVRDWIKKRHGWEPQERWLVKTPGVVFALAMAVQAYTEPGDAVLIQQPVYYPFSEVVEDNGRELVINELVPDEEGRYHIDFEDFERKIAEKGVKLFLLCSPHNPACRVWEEWELRKMGEICLRHHCVVASDEIHADIVFRGKHHVFASLGEEFAQNCVICTSASKTFNLASMLISNIFIPNPQLKHKFRHAVAAAGMSQLSALGITATEAAYQYGEEWYQAMLSYVRANIDFAREFVKTQMPKVRFTEPEGTYLLWLDFSALGLSAEELDRRIIYEAKLWLDSGKIFGKRSEGCQRLNLACPRSILAEALERVRAIVY